MRELHLRRPLFSTLLIYCTKQVVVACALLADFISNQCWLCADGLAEVLEALVEELFLHMLGKWYARVVNGGVACRYSHAHVCLLHWQVSRARSILSNHEIHYVTLERARARRECKLAFLVLKLGAVDVLEHCFMLSRHPFFLIDV